MVSRKEVQRKLLDVLIKKGALRIAPNVNDLFVFKSGRKSPNFINLGALTDGESLGDLKWCLGHFIGSLLKEKKIEDFDFIFGPAYKGIALSALACQGLYEFYDMNKRFLYDRKEVKNYGDKASDKVIVGAGYFKPGDKILIIDDVITTGATKIEAVEKLRLLGDCRLVGLVLVVDRQEKMGDVVRIKDKSAVENLQEKFGLNVYPILNMKTIFDLLKDDLNEDIKQCWINYYEKYGSIKLD